jgi:hypothetical protein
MDSSLLLNQPVQPQTKPWKWIILAATIVGAVILVLAWKRRKVGSSSEPVPAPTLAPPVDKNDPKYYLKAQFAKSGPTDEKVDEMELFREILQPANRAQFDACPNKASWTDMQKVQIFKRALDMGLRELAQGFGNMPAGGVTQEELRARGIQPQLQKFVQQMGLLMIMNLRLVGRVTNANPSDYFEYDDAANTVQLKGPFLQMVQRDKEKLKLQFDLAAPLPMDVFVPLILYGAIKDERRVSPPGYNECSICDPTCGMLSES